MICRNCHAENPETAKFCNQCGTKLETPSEQSSAAPERRQLTVVFSDLIGSTQLAEKLDPEDMRNVLKDYQSLCTRIVGLYDGYLSKFMGDGMLAYFGYPTAHEDDARRAIQAGLGIIEGMKTLSENHLKKTGVPIDVRVGIHTGLVVAGDMDKDQLEINAIVGQTPNVAARIQTAAEPNTLLISGDTYKLVRGFFETTDLGAHELKGISTAVHLYRVDHASTARSRLEAIGDLTPFAGRQAEIHTLETAWHRTQEGTTQTVMLCGEPGVGKSRLTHWLKQYAANDPDSWLSELQ
jgi:class 3 adenylate cyclase